MKNNMRIKKKIPFSVVFTSVFMMVVFYYSPIGFRLFNRTEKNYYYDGNGKKEHCLTAISHTGTFWDLWIADFQEDIGQGIYLIPYKFKGALPDKNYIRLSYIGNDNPIYYKWENDTLYLRIPYWKILENKLSPTVVLDTHPLNYERWGMFDSDTTRNVKDRQEWRQMKMEYKSFDKYDLN